MNTIEFLTPPKKEGKFFDNPEELKQMKLNSSSSPDPNHLSIQNFIPNRAFSTYFGNLYSDSGSFYNKRTLPERDKNGNLINFWCPFGSNMVYGIIEDNPKDWVDLWTRESRMFWRADESHPDSHKNISMRQNNCDFLTEGNAIFGFASLGDAMKYIDISSYNQKERKFLDDQILKFLGQPARENINGDYQKAPAIGSSVVIDPIAVLGKVSIELRKSAMPYGNAEEYRKCVKEFAIVSSDQKTIIHIVLYNIKLAGVKRIRINKDNESMFRVYHYTRKIAEGSYHTKIRNILTDTIPESEIDVKLHKKVVNNDTDIDREEKGSTTTLIREETEEDKLLDGFMGKEESNDIKFTLIPVGQDDLNDEEIIDKISEIADEALESQEKGLATATDEMIATEKLEVAAKTLDEDDMEDMSISEIESLAVEGDEELEEEDLDDTDYSDHYEEQIELPKECASLLKT